MGVLKHHRTRSERPRDFLLNLSLLLFAERRPFFCRTRVRDTSPKRDNFTGILDFFEWMTQRVAGDLGPANELATWVKYLDLDHFASAVEARLNSLRLTCEDGAAGSLNSDHRVLPTRKVEHVHPYFFARTVIGVGRRRS